MSVFEPLLANTLRVFESYDLDAQALFAAEGISFDLPLDPTVRISRTKYLCVRRRAAELSGDDYYSLRAAQLLHPGDLGALGFAWLASNRLRECFIRVERYFNTVSDDIFISVADKPPNLVVSYDPDSDLEPELLTSIAPGACLLQLSRDHLKKPFNLTEMKFSCKQPARISGFLKFFDCPISFGHRVNQLIIPLVVVDEPIPHSNNKLALLHDQLMDKYLIELGRHGIVAKVRAEIMRQLPAGSVTRDSVAASLQYSTRTMRHRLKAENISFKQLITQVRKELLGQYISDRSLSFSQIAFLLGFSEPSAFSRAHKDWFGHSPRTARNTL